MEGHLLPEFEGIVHLGLGDKDHKVVEEDDLHLLGDGGEVVLDRLDLSLLSNSLLRDSHDGIADKDDDGPPGERIDQWF